MATGVLNFRMNLLHTTMGAYCRDERGDLQSARAVGTLREICGIILPRLRAAQGPFVTPRRAGADAYDRARWLSRGVCAW
jgi:hypothetical protein